MTISDDDRKAFDEAMADVRRLKPGNRVEPETRRPVPRAGFSRVARQAVLDQSLYGPDPVESGEEIAFRRASVKQKVFRQLRRGEFALEAEVDLHGMRLSEARTALQEFLRECSALKLGCVRVIHGKGTRSGPEGPIIKPGVHHWLSRWDQVQAFVTAQPRHGGSGAVYVLLKRG